MRCGSATVLRVRTGRTGFTAEIIAALANGATLVAVSIYIFLEAYQRLWQPPVVQGQLMMWIAVGGLLVNLAGLWILQGGGAQSLNVRGAWLHVLSDALGSVGTIVAGILVWAFHWHWSDPVASVIIGTLIIYSSWRLLAESASVLMENAPKGIDVDAVRVAMAETPGVLNVHDLHIWSITSGFESLSATWSSRPATRMRCCCTRSERCSTTGSGLTISPYRSNPRTFPRRRVGCESLSGNVFTTAPEAVGAAKSTEHDGLGGWSYVDKPVFGQPLRTLSWSDAFSWGEFPRVQCCRCADRLTRRGCRVSFQRRCIHQYCSGTRLMLSSRWRLYHWVSSGTVRRWHVSSAGSAMAFRTTSNLMGPVVRVAYRTASGAWLASENRATPLWHDAGRPKKSTQQPFGPAY